MRKDTPHQSADMNRMMGGARGGLTADSFNTRGPVPGNPRAITQRKAIAEGYAAAPTARVVHTHQSEGVTGKSDSPGLTSRSGGKRKGADRG